MIPHTCQAEPLTDKPHDAGNCVHCLRNEVERFRMDIGYISSAFEMWDAGGFSDYDLIIVMKRVFAKESEAKDEA